MCLILKKVNCAMGKCRETELSPVPVDWCMAGPQSGDIHTYVVETEGMFNILLYFSVGKIPSQLQTWLLA